MQDPGFEEERRPDPYFSFSATLYPLINPERRPDPYFSFSATLYPLICFGVAIVISSYPTPSLRFALLAIGGVGTSRSRHSFTARYRGIGQRVMSLTDEENKLSQSQLSSQVFGDLLDSIIADVASECHRIARLGLDRNLEEEEEEMKLSAEARVRVANPSTSNETNAKYVVDIFGQTHPPVANENFECMNCGRTVVAGRFAPHLEKCMGKGRKTRPKVTRSTTAAQNRYSRGSPVSSYSPYSNSSGVNRLANGTSGIAGEEYSNGTFEP